jgi:hypothetical protein
MITAKEAKDISDNLNSQKSKECLEQIDCRIRKAAAESYTEVEISDLKPVSSVLLYLESLGYIVKTIAEETYNTPLSIKVQW